MATNLDQSIDQLTRGNADQQATAAEALAQLGPEAQSAAVALVRACGSGDEKVRAWAVAALENLGPPTADQIAPLAKLARESQGDAAYWAVTLLGRAGNSAASAVDTLAKILQRDSSSELYVRERSAWALCRIGPAAKAARPALVDASKSAQIRLARLATEALESIGE